MIVSRRGPIGAGQFPAHDWHKKERENLIKQLGIKVERGQVPEEARDRGKYKTVGSQEHSDLIKEYIESGLGMVALGEKIDRSSASVHSHIERHNSGVETLGFCPSCRKVKGPYETALARRG